MNNTILVMLFTIKEMIKKKAFIVINVIIFAIILISVNIPNILSLFEVDLADNFIEKVLIVDENNIFEDSLTTISELELSVTTEIINKNISEEEIKTKIEEEKIDYAVIYNKNGNDLNIDYITDEGNITYNAETIITYTENLYKNLQINKLNLTEEELASINPISSLNIIKTSEAAVDSELSTGIGSVLSLILFMSIYFFAYQVSSAVTTEKTSKIVETLLTSTSTKSIIIGKTLGVGIVGIIQIISIILFTIITGIICLPNNIITDLIDMLNIAPIVVVICLIYFILGYLLFSFLFALSGAMVNRIEDVQLANTPVNLITVLGFYLGYFTMFDPNGMLNTVAGYIPISSAYTMPTRYILGLSSITDVLISFIILIVSIIIIAYISIRIYSNAILNNGSKMNLKELIKMYKNKSDL